VSPRAVLDAVMRKIPSPRRESNPRTPIVQEEKVPGERKLVIRDNDDDDDDDVMMI
jgi:hypothetical protein